MHTLSSPTLYPEQYEVALLLLIFNFHQDKQTSWTRNAIPQRQTRKRRENPLQSEGSVKKNEGRSTETLELGQSDNALQLRVDMNCSWERVRQTWVLRVDKMVY
uniref:Uncharacterized protein n=1 Tax=Pristionchus pacificus TaxID=54126 RepID=A0A2A6CJX4_PRIPA|eukprot:PDM78410.1 hypothetical protein PRIPAC_30989 [Pristionchus pacificus]